MAQTHTVQGKSLVQSLFIDAPRKDYEQKQQEYDAVVVEAGTVRGYKDIEGLEEKTAKGALFNEAADK